MKLAITSDEHLGKTLYRTEDDSLNKFERKLYNVWKENIDIIIKEKPDFYISCGDSFDIPNPKVIPIMKYKEQMARLKENNIPSLLIMGNHDFNFKNKQNEASVLNMLIPDLLVSKYAEYEVDYYIKDNFLFVLAPFIYSKDNHLVWERVNEICEENKELHKVLITHGITELYLEKFPMLESEYMIVPTKTVELFNEVLIGHIHVPYVEKYKNTTIISPGALINYAEPNDETGPLFLEYNDKNELVNIRREHIDTPHTIKITCNSDNINDILDSVSENIYKIYYQGDTDSIDNVKFTEARNRAINLVLEIEKFDKEEDLVITNKENMKDFISWIDENYKDKLDDFQNAKENIYNNKGE